MKQVCDNTESIFPTLPHCLLVPTLINFILYKNKGIYAAVTTSRFLSQAKQSLPQLPPPTEFFRFFFP